jgi:hypothetical protein
MKNALLLLFMASILSLNLVADDSMAVDDADNFSPEFHESKAEEIKFYDSSTGTFFGREKSKAEKAQDNANPQASGQASFEIYERYTLTRSDKTPYSAFYVIEALHTQMATQCPSGWNKVEEWSVSVESDYYLHYKFTCR